MSDGIHDFDRGFDDDSLYKRYYTKTTKTVEEIFENFPEAKLPKNILKEKEIAQKNGK